MLPLPDQILFAGTAKSETFNYLTPLISCMLMCVLEGFPTYHTTDAYTGIAQGSPICLRLDSDGAASSACSSGILEGTATPSSCFTAPTVTETGDNMSFLSDSQELRRAC